MCTDSDEPDVPFSLVCEACDAGTEMNSHAEAVAAGWRDIEYAPDQPQANYVGRCPDCRRAGDTPSEPFEQ
jgi:hypothetical protein